MWIRNNSRHTTMRILLMAMWIQSSCWCACSKPPPSFHFNFNFYFSVWGRLTPDVGQQAWDGGDLQRFWPRLWPDYEKKWHMQLLLCNAFCLQHLYHVWQRALNRSKIQISTHCCFKQKLWPYRTNWQFTVHSCVSRRDQEAESDVPPLQRRLEI